MSRNSLRRWNIGESDVTVEIYGTVALELLARGTLCIFETLPFFDPLLLDQHQTMMIWVLTPFFEIEIPFWWKVLALLTFRLWWYHLAHLQNEQKAAHTNRADNITTCCLGCTITRLPLITTHLLDADSWIARIAVLDAHYTGSTVTTLLTLGT